MEGVPPSFMEDDVNQLEEVPSLPQDEVLVNQSSMLCNDKAGQNRLVDNNDSIQQTTQFPPSFPPTMTTMGGLDGTSSSCINQNGPNWPQTPSRFPQFPHNHQVSGEYDVLNPTCYDSTLFEPTSSSRIQYFPNQGQVEQASVIPNIDNMQQENLVPQNYGKSTRSQMDNLQVPGLQNQTARPIASNPGPDSSLQSENRGLNTQQVQRAGSRDPFWNYVKEEDDGSMICKFCQRRWASKIPISRFKWHLSGEKDHNVTICLGVTKEVQEEALKAMRGGNKRHKSTTSSINVNDLEVLGNLVGSARRIQVGVQGMEQGAGEERTQSHLEAENDMEDTGEGSSGHDKFQTIPRTGQLQRAQGMIKARTEPVEEVVLKKSGRLAEQAAAGARSTESMKSNKTKGVPFPTRSNKLVGQAFEENTKVIWSLLVDDEVSTIGIYGMGGVGKTTILQHIHNELLERPDICDHLWWVTVSQDFSINRLQDHIAKRLELKLSSEDDDSHRAAKLSEELWKKQKWILILDDLWNSFELHDIGIHSSFKGCKLILTTRSQTICDQIDCQHKIEVKPLFEGESWTLFKDNLGHHITLSDEVEEIAKVVARECADLPLGIITIARSLRGVDDLPEWRTTLKKLRELNFRDMDEKVLKVLRVSYDRLDDGLALNQCLLYCALFPEDHRIQREELIGYLIDEGIIKGMRSRQDAFDEGHTMLNRLQYVCLLESVIAEDGAKCVKMHDLIRDMAIQILQENSQVIVKAGAQLEELSDGEEYWTENLTIVSLMQNRFKEIPPSNSPMCPNLSTLFLCDNSRLRFIADSFFKHLHGLKVLDLSRTDIVTLPESVSDLLSLTALLLINCWSLRDIPSLQKLRALKRLDVLKTRLKKMPQGMECLSNLRYLRMNGCGKQVFPIGILQKLSHLQVLVLDETSCGSYAPITVIGKEVGSLRNLETLECNFEDLSDFVEYLRYRNGIRSLSTYRISVGAMNKYDWDVFDYFPSKTVWFRNLSINVDRDFQVKFLNDIERLVCECIDARSLCDVLSLENATKLKIVHILDIDSMENLVSSSWLCSAPSYKVIFSSLHEFYCFECRNMKNVFPLVMLPNLVNLERIEVASCEKMEDIIGGTRSDEEGIEFKLPKLRYVVLRGLPELKSICSAKLICDSLKEIKVFKCHSMEILVPSSWSCLVNLEEILVIDCGKMKEIIRGTKSDEEGVMGEESSELKLRKLKSLYLIGLPKLKSICSAKLICDYLQVIGVTNCEKLKRMAICLPLLENGQPSLPPSLEHITAYPKEWWETVVEWEHPNAKEVLRPIVQRAAPRDLFWNFVKKKG